VTRGIKEHPEACLRLVLGILRTEFERMCDRDFEVTHLKVEVHHDLLRTLAERPDGAHVIGRRLKGKICHAVGWSNRRILRLILRDLPPEHIRVEPGQRAGVGCLQDSAPPVAPGPA